MCGIAGFTGPQNEALLSRMTTALAHRGPDGQGFFSNDRISLGHRRLSIIDIAGGTQPMIDDTKKIVVIFNGEIYNYRELKETLSAKYHFVSNSDTEVILYLYREHGEKFVQHLNGMFAIALWDDNTQTLLLARDRMGEKPLYYKEDNGNIYFASEPKSLLASGANMKMNMAAVSQFFLLQYIPDEQSIYEGMYKVLPGQLLSWHAGEIKKQQYWQATSHGVVAGDIQHVQALVREAVQSRLVSDVPLGVFLSGGIDSTTVAYFAQQYSRTPIQTFSIGFDDKSFDESAYAELAAKHIGSEHHHQVFSAKDLLAALPEICAKLDEPMADASILPTYVLSKFTRQSVTVALGGDGSDELFGGYPTFAAHRLADVFARMPNISKKILESIINHLPVSHANFSLDFKLKRFIRGAAHSGVTRELYWTSSFSPEEQQLLLKPEVYTSNPIAETFSLLNLKETESIDAVFTYWQRGYLVDDILTKVDRASMFNSLEVRAPLLDHRLVEYINTLRYTDKVRGKTTKYILKQAMKGLIPDSIINRPKKGFGIPISQWLRTDLQPLLRELTSHQSLEQVGIFQEAYVQRLVNEHVAGTHDHRLKLWPLMCFMLWHKQWCTIS